MKNNLQRFLMCGVALVLGISSVSVWAQTVVYPARPIRLVVPTPAGGPTDVLARVLGQKLSDAWGQPVVIDNRPGANQIIGTNLVAKSAPDGYTLLMTVDSTMTMHQFAYKKLPYDPAKEFVPVAIIANSFVLLVAGEALPVKSLADVIKLAKADPGKLSVGTGTLTTQVIAERLRSLSGTKMLPVSYAGSGQLTLAVLAGSIDLAVDGYVSYKDHVAKRNLKLLAITGAQRSPVLPDVPTFAELGFPGFDTGVWLGMSAPAGTSPEIVKKLSDQIGLILAMPDVKERLLVMGMEPLSSTPESTAAFIKSEANKWGKVIQEVGITLD